MTKAIILKGTVEGVATRKDRTIKISFSTQELKGKDAAQLLDLQNQLVSLGISVVDITDEEVELLASNKFGIEDLPNNKSLSKQYRDVLYVYWTQYDTGFDTFKEFYKDHYTKRIDNVKSKLEP